MASRNSVENWLPPSASNDVASRRLREEPAAGDDAALAQVRPGESAQPIHTDDQVIPLPKPHPLTVCNTMWALTDFTEEHGATRLVPGSHLADTSPEYGTHYDSVPAEMPAGGVLVWHARPGLEGDRLLGRLIVVGSVPTQRRLDHRIADDHSVVPCRWRTNTSWVSWCGSNPTDPAGVR